MEEQPGSPGTPGKATWKPMSAPATQTCPRLACNYFPPSTITVTTIYCLFPPLLIFILLPYLVLHNHIADLDCKETTCRSTRLFPKINPTRPSLICHLFPSSHLSPRLSTSPSPFPSRSANVTAYSPIASHLPTDHGPPLVSPSTSSTR